MVNAELIDTPQGQRIFVTFPYSPQAVQAVKDINGRKFVPAEEGGPAWQFPLDLKIGRQLREAFGDELEVGPKLRRWGNSEVRRTTELRSMATADDAELKVLPNVLPDVCDLIAGKPLPHISPRLATERPDRKFQRADIAFMAKNSCINANQPGLGKTIETIASIFEGETDHGPQLVITPKTSVRATWEKHLLTWQPYPVLCYTLEGTSKTELEAIIAKAREYVKDGVPFWFVTNPAQVQMKNVPTGKFDDFGDEIMREVPKLPFLYEQTWNNMICDEYHKMGLTNTKTLTSKAVLRIPREGTKLLSGTPMGGKPIKLFAGLQIVAPDQFTSKWRWAEQWIGTEENEYGKTIGKTIMEGREDEFYEYHAPFLLRRTKEEVLPELPPKTIIDVECEMTPTQRKQYLKVAKETALRIDTEDMPITSILAEYTRLRQFSNARCEVRKTGKIKDGIPEIAVTPTTDSGKLPHLMEILEKLGIAGKDQEGAEQVVVFSQFSQTTEMVAAWCAAQDIPVAMITGKTKQKDREQIAADFQEGLGARVLCMTTTAGGTSLTLDGYCSTVVFMDETWDPDDQEQGEDRVHRASRMHQVTVYYLRSKDGIEQYIQDLVGSKFETNVAILDVHRMNKKEVSLA